MSRPLFSLILCAAAGVLLPTAARATTTVSTSWSDIECGLIASDGTRTVQPCTGPSPSFSALAQPGQSVYVSATLNYTYSDDGLRLDRPWAYQVDENGLRVQVVEYESAGLYLYSNDCRTRSCPRPPDVVTFFTGEFLLLLGNNDTPDSFSGQRRYTAGSGIPAGDYFPSVRSAWIGVGSVIQSVTPVPEPQTWALMLTGLGALAWAARRPMRRA
jgi:hypothetical protein